MISNRKLQVAIPTAKENGGILHTLHIEIDPRYHGRVMLSIDNQEKFTVDNKALLAAAQAMREYVIMAEQGG